MDGGHNHLDRQRRPPGQCPGCDADWARQRARLDAAAVPGKVTKQLDRMAERPVVVHKFCTATRLVGRHEHHCADLAAHPPPHRCPLCGEDW